MEPTQLFSHRLVYDLIVENRTLPAHSADHPYCFHPFSSLCALAAAYDDNLHALRTGHPHL